MDTLIRAIPIVIIVIFLFCAVIALNTEDDQ